MVESGIRIEGLREFRADLKRALGANPRELARALRESGAILPPKIRSGAPQATGKLAGSVGSPTATGTKARIPIRAKHAVYAEFQTKGKYGATMTAKYGPPPRFGYRAVDESADELAERVYEGLKEIVTLYGWAKE
jgi:hypothetical protein